MSSFRSYACIAGYLEKLNPEDSTVSTKYVHLSAPSGSIFLNETNKNEIICNNNEKYSIEPASFPNLDAKNFDKVFKLCETLTGKWLHQLEVSENLFQDTLHPAETQFETPSFYQFDIQSSSDEDEDFVTLKKRSHSLNLNCGNLQLHIYVKPDTESEVMSFIFDKKWSYKRNREKYGPVKVMIDSTDTHEDMCSAIRKALSASSNVVTAFGLVHNKVIE
jgi:hypothetical protein